MNHAIPVEPANFKYVIAIANSRRMRYHVSRTGHGAEARAIYPEAYMPRALKLTYINVIILHGTVCQQATMLPRSVT